MTKIGLSRLAAYTDVSKNNELVAGLHFLLEENSLEEVLLQVKLQYGLESELKKKLPPIFEVVESVEDVLNPALWIDLPKEIQSLASNAMFESIARCTKRQISLIKIKNQRTQLLNTFGRQFGPETNFCVVEFVYNSTILPLAVTATRIQK